MEITLTIKEILNVIQAERCDEQESFLVQRIASLSRAQAGDLAVIFDRGDASVFDHISKQEIINSKAGIFLAKKSVVEGKKYILVPDVLAAFTKLVAFLQKVRRQSTVITTIADDAVVHSSAVIAPGAVIKSGAEIGAQVYVGAGCSIGAHTILYPGVKVLDGCIIGDHSIVHAGTVIGSDGFGYEVAKNGLRKIPHIGIVRIGSYVEIGANCMLDRAAFDETIVGDGVKMDNGVHIAHNVIIGPCSAILAQTGIAGSAVIGYGCQIGGQVAIKDHVTIGNNVKIVSKGAVMNDLNDGDVVAGIPAIAFTQWKRLTVALSKIPELVKHVGIGSTIRPAHKSWWQRFFS